MFPVRRNADERARRAQKKAALAGAFLAGEELERVAAERARAGIRTDWALAALQSWPRLKRGALIPPDRITYAQAGQALRAAFKAMGWQEKETRCPRCEGTGSIWSEGSPFSCPQCRGRGAGQGQLPLGFPPERDPNWQPIPYGALISPEFDYFVTIGSRGMTFQEWREWYGPSFPGGELGRRWKHLDLDRLAWRRASRWPVPFAFLDDPQNANLRSNDTRTLASYLYHHALAALGLEDAAAAAQRERTERARKAKPKSNPYRKWTQGACGTFAATLHKLTGWPIYAITHELPGMTPGSGPDYFYDAGGDIEVVHAFVVTPDGMALDATGLFELPRDENRMVWEANIGTDRHPETGEKGQWWVERVRPLTLDELRAVRCQSEDVDDPEWSAEAVAYIRSRLAETIRKPGHVGDNPLTRFQNDHIDHHHGQDDYVLWALDGDEKLGLLSYSMFRDDIHINMVRTREDLKRQGIGRALFKELIRLWPDAAIHPGLQTPEGSALWKSVVPEIRLQRRLRRARRRTDRNPDERMRDLERRARAGDQEAADRFRAMRARSGLETPAEVFMRIKEGDTVRLALGTKGKIIHERKAISGIEDRAEALSVAIGGKRDEPIGTPASASVIHYTDHGPMYQSGVLFLLGKGGRVFLARPGAARWLPVKWLEVRT